MNEKRYIHIRNWERFQHPDTTRAKQSAIPWIKSYTGQLSDEDYVGLTWSDRGLLEALRLQYAMNRGRGINEVSTNLFRLFGHRVRKDQLERLNHAGFIEFSASKSLAGRLQHASPEEETEREIETEQDQEPSFLPSVAKDPAEPSINGHNDGRTEQENGTRAEQLTEAVAQSWENL